MSDLKEIIFTLLFSGGSLTWSMVDVQGKILKLLFYKIRKNHFLTLKVLVWRRRR